MLAYHNWRVTNGYTEGVHTKIKLPKRISYGFRNRGVYVRKTLLAFLPLAWLISTLLGLEPGERTISVGDGGDS
ncbi:transposase [Desulfothermobacter acidiphilus]|uniref:transposase n=1 Tax=Desulfothermobacter acidiphilus TaxID=1938353 RepID=UPI003F8B6595